MIHCFFELKLETENFSHVAAQAGNGANGVQFAIVIRVPGDTLQTWVPFSESVFALALFVFINEHLLGHYSDNTAWNIDPADSHCTDSRGESFSEFSDWPGFQILGLVGKIHERTFIQPLGSTLYYLIFLFIIRSKINKLIQSCNLAFIQCKLTKIRLFTFEFFLFTCHSLRIFMTTLLIKVPMVNSMLHPLLSILIPGLISFTALLFPLNLNPLKHFNSPNQPHCLIKCNIESFVFDWLISVAVACAMD